MLQRSTYKMITSMQADLADDDSNWFVCTNRLVVLLSGPSRDNFGSDV